MKFDSDTLKQLIETFNVELEEQTQIIIDCLLNIEKQTENREEFNKTIETIFRAAHNIKGAARGIGIHDVGEIAHHIESIFSAIQKNEIQISSPLIDLCLEAVDDMRLSMNAFLDKKTSTVDVPELLKRLKNIFNKNQEEKKEKKSLTQKIENIEIHSEPHHHDQESVRVSIDQLDKVSALTEEIQVNKISIDDQYHELYKISEKINQFSKEWSKLILAYQSNSVKDVKEYLKKLTQTSTDYLYDINHSTTKLQKNMRPRVNELSTLSNSLQDEVRLLRLVPISYLLKTFHRSVRDLAHKFNKKIELKIIGEEVKIDKIVLDGLKDPIMHIINNAIDHGIESPEERKKIDKPELGMIIISIKDEGSEILIDISDDGSGIDVQKITQTALLKNLISKTDLEKMTNETLLDLIFKSGFSTKEIITEISGRGVGLDVVKTNISNLKGEVRITTELGKGTTFHLRVPLTLTSERGLLITTQKRSFVIPSSNVERVLILSVNDILNIEASQAILLNHQTIPLRSLDLVLGLGSNIPIPKEKLAIVVVKSGWSTVAFLVDTVEGEKEIVIKPLQDPLTQIPCIAGGTLSSEGNVIIVLNPNHLVNSALQVNHSTRVSLSDTSEKNNNIPHILVVDDSITTRTLEKNILESKGYQVTVAVNGKEAWDMLQKTKYSLLITDVSMPIMDGFTLTEHVKQDPVLNVLPVIIVTSLDSEQEKKRGIDVGANAYVVKNEFESGALLEIVSQLV